MTIDAQRSARVAIVTEALRRIGGVVDPEVEHDGGVPATGYRTTVRVVGASDGRAGFRSESSHDVVAAPACLIAHPQLAALLLADLRLDDGVEPTLRVSAATGELAARWDRSKGDVHGLPDGTPVGSSVTLQEDVCGHRLQVSMGSFFQSGPTAAEALVEAVQRAAPELADARLVVDAYAGIGMFARCATAPGTRVIAIETSRSAVADACHNLSDRDAQVVRGEVGGWHAPPDVAVDVVIADPARTGLGKPGVHALARAKAPVLVLVSCDPASLGRDAKLLAAAGYQPRAVRGRRHVSAHDAGRGRDTLRPQPATGRRVITPVVSAEVGAALADGRPVVALESTIFSHLGLPSPANEAALTRCVEAIVDGGAVPALTAVLDGRPRVGLAPSEHERILGPARKTAERDLAVAIAQAWDFGATTVSASLALAAAAGVAVFATGGIGGVHRGAEQTGDVSVRSRRHRPPPDRDGVRRRQGLPRPAAHARVPGDRRSPGARMAPRLLPGLLHPLVGLGGPAPRRVGGRGGGACWPTAAESTPACC